MSLAPSKSKVYCRSVSSFTGSYVILDTPGQIEIFTWSASGAIITDAVASSLPTVVAYIIDTPRTTAPATFMSNMLYACRSGLVSVLLQHTKHDLTNVSSILYKTKLPFILVFNKTDVRPHDFAVEWMQDFEAFQAALATHQGTTDDEGEPTYMNSLMNSMSLVLDEFYKHLTVSVLPRLSPVAFLIGSGSSIGRGRVQCYRCGGEGVLRRRRRLPRRVRKVRY